MTSKTLKTRLCFRFDHDVAAAINALKARWRRKGVIASQSDIVRHAVLHLARETQAPNG